MEYGPVIALSIVTLLAVLIWGAVQLGLVRRSRKKGDHSAFAHREPTAPALADVDKQRQRDHQAGIDRDVYKPQR